MSHTRYIYLGRNEPVPRGAPYCLIHVSSDIRGTEIIYHGASFTLLVEPGLFERELDRLANQGHGVIYVKNAPGWSPRRTR